MTIIVMRVINDIENIQRVDNQLQLYSESTGGIKADLVLKVNALLVGDVLPSRANNSANDQDSVQLRILEVV